MYLYICHVVCMQGVPWSFSALRLSLKLIAVISLSIHVMTHQVLVCLFSLHCTLSLTAQCIVIGPVCGGERAACVCGSVTRITPKCVHRSSPNWVCRKGSDRLQLIKFWPSRARGKGSAAGQKLLAPPYYSQRAVFASL